MFRKQRVIIWISLSLFVFQSLVLQGQENKDSVLIVAMKHELNRNMKELSKDGFEDPFFISYTIADIKTAYASAKLGALTGSGENEYKDWNVRVMVGDYDINDENFISSENQPNVSRVAHEMPVEDDYLGIRMALWSVTDNVYNAAADQYKEKMMLIEEDKVQEDMLGTSDFSKADVVKMILPTEKVVLDKKALEEKSRSMSAIFRDYPELMNSSVSINQIAATIYFINSEGTEVVYPMQYSAISVNAGLLTDQDENIAKGLVYSSPSVSDLVDNSIVLSDVRFLLEDLKKSSQMEHFEDDYSGPVLYQDEAVAQVVASKLFSYNNKFAANRKPLKRKDQVGTYYEDKGNSKQWKIGKKVMGNDISITEYSALKSFDNMPLWGKFDVDGEGVVPPDSMVLVKNGILLNKFNGRTPTKEVDSTNGHMRFSLSFGGVGKDIAPGIIKFESSAPKKISELKEQLIEMAKDEGLEYGILVKCMPVNANEAPLVLYKVMVETGEEIPIHGVRLGTFDIKEFKDLAGVSDSLIVSNFMLSRGYSGISGSEGGAVQGNGGTPVSFIVPSAMLLEEVEVSPKRIRFSNMKPIVSSPLLED